MHRDREGFTLIEILIVVVIIGILAAVAIPKYTRVKSQGYVATVKSDLKNLSTAEESYFAASNTYATSAQLAVENYFAPSRGVNVTISSITSTGWSATATHGGFSGMTACGVYVGTATSPDASLNLGQVGCW